MSNANTIFHYEEWSLKPDSKPGWKLVLDFISSLVRGNTPFYGWIFGLDSNRHVYTDLRFFDSQNNPAFLSYLNEFIKKDSVLLVRLRSNTPICHLLQAYLQVKEGVIMNKENLGISPHPIEKGEWMALSDEEIVLVIHHDGDPLFLIKKEATRYSGQTNETRTN